MIKNRLLYLGGLLAALIFHIFYFGWYSWYLLVLMLCLPWFVLLISLPAMLRLRLKLTLPEQCTAGDTAFLQLSTGKNKGILPPYHLRLRVKNTLDGKIVTVRPRKVRKLQGKLALDTTHCGILQCSAKGSRVCDYLGLFALPVRGSQERELLVLPRPVPPDPLPNLTAFATGRRRPKPGGGFSEEHELREYRPGDPLRNRIGSVDLRLTSGTSPVHSDMLLWNTDDSVESAALELINILFSVPQISVRLETLPDDHKAMLRFYLQLWNTYRDCLMHGRMTALHPEANYSLVYTETPDTLTAVSFSQNLLAPQQFPRETVFVNGSWDDELLLKNADGAFDADVVVYDCTGRVVSESTATIVTGYNVFPVPRSGVLKVVRK